MHRVNLKPLALLLFAVAAYSRSYTADSYNVQLQLTETGQLEVTETTVFRFLGGPFTYVYRDIDAARTDGIAGVQAWFDGVPCAPGTGPGQVEIRGRSPVRVRWHMAPASNETHTFVVRYRAFGVIRKQQAAQALVWNALPPDRSYSIGSSEIVLRYPANKTPQTVSLGRSEIAADSDGATARLYNIAGHRAAVIQANFAPGTFPVGLPDWQARQAARVKFLYIGMLWGGVIAALVAIFAVLGFSSRADSRAPAVSASSLNIQAPPDTLPPALAAKLAGRAGGPAGTLLDLARRGILRIEEGKRGYFHSRSYRIELLGRTADLARHEALFLDFLFRDGETSVRMADFASRMARRASKLQKAVRDELAANGVLDVERASRRTNLVVAGTLGTFLGPALIGLGFALANSSHPEVFGAAIVLGAALLILGITGLIAGGLLSPWTETGQMTAARWKAFARHLGKVARGRLPVPGAEDLERFLPYAAAFGIAAPLLKRRQKEGTVPVPPWFAALDSDDGTAALMAFLVSSDSTAATAGGGDGGASAGASGGGSSGAG